MAGPGATLPTAALAPPADATAPLDGEDPGDGGRLAPRAVGEVFGGRYRIDQLLARGGMADVYAATELDTRRPVALKLAAEDPLQPGSASGQLLREAEILTRLHHANVVAVHHYGRTPQGLAFLVLERVTGPTLREFIAQSPALPWRTTVAVVTQIALALSAAHALGVVHSDLSPANVLLARADRSGLMCKLVDFGIARRERESSVTPLRGTRRYLAPEARRGARADARLDLYALGVILAEMLARAPQEPPAALVSLSRALQAPDPEDRPPGALTVVEALRRIAHRGERTPPRSPRTKLSLRLAAGAAGSTVLLAIGALVPLVQEGPERAGDLAPLRRGAPPALHAQLQDVPLRLQRGLPELPLPATAAAVTRIARPKAVVHRAAPPRPSPRAALLTALLRRREWQGQHRLAPEGDGMALADAEPQIAFDPSEQSARVVYPAPDALGRLRWDFVEYWVVREGRWQPLDGD